MDMDDLETWNEIIENVNKILFLSNYRNGTHFQMKKLLSEEDSISSLKEGEEKGFTWDLRKI